MYIHFLWLQKKISVRSGKKAEIISQQNTRMSPLSSVVPLPRWAVKQKARKVPDQFPRQTHTQFHYGGGIYHITLVDVRYPCGGYRFSKDSALENKWIRCYLAASWITSPLFPFFLLFFCSVTSNSTKLMSMGNKGPCQQGSGFVCPELGCSLLSELSNSGHRFLRRLCACQPTCPSLPLPFSLPPSLQPEASLILRAPAPACWSLSLMSFHSG